MNKILIDRAVVEQTLEALWTSATPKSEDAITALRAALAEPVQEAEPVAIADGTFNHDCPIGTLLYTSPPQRPAEPVQEPAPMPPFPPVSLWKRGCAVCGIGAGGHAYGYACPRSDCPTRVTCGGTV